MVKAANSIDATAELPNKLLPWVLGLAAVVILVAVLAADAGKKKKD